MVQRAPKTFHSGFDVETKEGFQRLQTAVRESWNEMEPMRKTRKAIIQQMVGTHYGQNGPEELVPVNRIQQAMQVFARQAIASNPRVLNTTRFPELRPTAFRFENALNKRIKAMNLRDTLQEGFVNAEMSLGVVKVGLREGPAMQFKQKVVRSTKVFVDSISPDDWVHDVMAPRWDQAMFFGDFYELPLEAVKRSNLYNREVRRTLVAAEKRESSEEGARVSRDKNIDRLEDMIRLCDIWLPQHGQLVTMVDPSMENGGDAPLRVMEWEGPVTGPYHILGLQRVPDNIMPLGPALAWLDLHIMQNEMFRKTTDQALAEKKVFAYRSDAVSDAENMRDADDNEFIKMDHPDGVNDFSIGGASQTGVAMLGFLDQQFNRAAGNVDALSGLGPQSDTVGQDQIIVASASAMLQELQEKAVDWTRDIVQSVAFWTWHDPFIDEQFEVPLGDTGMTIQSQFSAEEIEGEFPDYDIDIALFSLQEKSPRQRLQSLMQGFQGLVMPMQANGMLQQASIQVDPKELLDLYARYENVEDEFSRILKTAPGGPEPEGQKTGQNEKPAFQHKTVERVNRPGANPRQQSAAIMNTLLGQKPQDAELAAVGRPTG